ncbi:putative secreted protein (Por secretion system target) [Aquimarina sp. MAR_2010_214]|uniref:T9SS type A sorting domain-containing protein n=1 Tax=Aquimarina sp. MAR_2010_214 TaxID=1250026 RepID=UPI000C714DA3|nr:T9SS type A sorting domain-containing protein [Aquimarina sp. MAR_2010_214]PKV51967.1 putative secreted protein (Por secretion system target) [Aquimarina sp. MAR_2010_214]
MRKFLLLVMLSITFTTFAQDYQLTVSGNIGSGPSSCGSIEGLQSIKAIFDDGSEDFLFDNSGRFVNRTYSFSQKYSESKRLVGVKFKSVSRSKRVSRCKKRISEKLVNVSSPSFYKKFTKNEIYEQRINSGDATITVVQVIDTAQNYELTVSGNIGSGPSSCGSIEGLQSIKAIFEDGSEDFLFDNSGRFINRTYSFSQKYSESKRLVGVKFKSVSRSRRASRCKKRISEKLVSVSSPSFYKKFTKNEIYEQRINSGDATITVVQTTDINKSNQSITLIDNQELLNKSSNKESKLFETSVYPNPSPDGRFNINVSSAKPLPVLIQIFDLVDKRKILEDIKSGNTEYIFEFNSYNLKPGFYLVQIESGGKTQFEKLIIE